MEPGEGSFRASPIPSKRPRKHRGKSLRSLARFDTIPAFAIKNTTAVEMIHAGARVVEKKPKLLTSRLHQSYQLHVHYPENARPRPAIEFFDRAATNVIH